MAFFRQMEFFTIIHIMALRKSVQLNMPHLIYKIEFNCNFDEGMLSCGVFIYLKKAFDTVYHFILLQKNTQLWHKRYHSWFKFHFYLTDHAQSTQIGSEVSTKFSTACGISQGSVLGPLLLFLLYVNDLYT